MSTFAAKFGSPSFDGIARLFPLPNLVMFPHTLQPLHVFEPRYRKLVAEALAGDKLIAMVLLEPGWEADYEGSPPIARVGCLGRIASSDPLADGRFNILLAGLTRVRIEGELAKTKIFREARVQVLEDRGDGSDGPEQAALHRQLLKVFSDKMPKATDLEQVFKQVNPAGTDSLGMLTDVMSSTLLNDLSVKQRLLEEERVEVRARTLLDALSAGQPLTTPDFPPGFSLN